MKNDKEIVCDRCKKSYDLKDDIFEVQEFLSWKDSCGYGANTSFRYADLDRISIDLCQNCKHDVLGEFMVVEKHQW